MSVDGVLPSVEHLLDFVAVESPGHIGLPVYGAEWLAEAGREFDTLVVYAATVGPDAGITGR